MEDGSEREGNRKEKGSEENGQGCGAGIFVLFSVSFLFLLIRKGRRVLQRRARVRVPGCRLNPSEPVCVEFMGAEADVLRM